MFKRTFKTVVTTAFAITLVASNVMTAQAAPMKVGVSDLFDAEYYAEQNSDVKAAFGNNAQALLNHYLKYGIKEGRSFSRAFDLNRYKALYGDLSKAFGNNWELYVNHYLTFGINESRDGGGEFDIVAYMQNNRDVVDAFGLDFAAIKKHYEMFGKAEGRVAMSPALADEIEAAAQAAEQGDDSEEDEFEYNGSTEFLYADGAYYDWTSYCGDMEVWRGEEPNRYDYTDDAAYDAAIVAWEAKEPDKADYIYAYADEETAEEAYLEAHEEWEENMPDPDDYTTDEYAELYEAYVLEHPEPMQEDYPYYENGFADETEAREMYEIGCQNWENIKQSVVAMGYEEGTPEFEEAMYEFGMPPEKPSVEEFLASININIYDSEEDAYNTYLEAYAQWEENGPDPADYHDQESYESALEAHYEMEPKREDFVTLEDMGEDFTNTYESADDANLAYDEAYTEWSEYMPDEDAYVDEEAFEKAYETWMESVPELEDYEVEEEDIPEDATIIEPVG